MKGWVESVMSGCQSFRWGPPSLGASFLSMMLSLAPSINLPTAMWRLLPLKPPGVAFNLSGTCVARCCGCCSTTSASHCGSWGVGSGLQTHRARRCHMACCRAGTTRTQHRAGSWTRFGKGGVPCNGTGRCRALGFAGGSSC